MKTFQVIYTLIFDAQSLLMTYISLNWLLWICSMNILPVLVLTHLCLNCQQSQGNFDCKQVLDALSDPSKTGDMVVWSWVLLVENTFSGDHTLYYLNIYIIDETDNVPVFKQPYRFNITTGQRIAGILSVSGNDAGKYSEVTFYGTTFGDTPL